MAGLLKLGSLWKGIDKNGNEMLSGNVDVPVCVSVDENTRVVILANSRKEAENHPDFELFLTKNEKQDGSNSG